MADHDENPHTPPPNPTIDDHIDFTSLFENLRTLETLPCAGRTPLPINPTPATNISVPNPPGEPSIETASEQQRLEAQEQQCQLQEQLRMQTQEQDQQERERKAVFDQSVQEEARRMMEAELQRRKEAKKERRVAEQRKIAARQEAATRESKSKGA